LVECLVIVVVERAFAATEHTASRPELQRGTRVPRRLGGQGAVRRGEWSIDGTRLVLPQDHEAVGVPEVAAERDGRGPVAHARHPGPMICPEAASLEHELRTVATRIDRA